MKFHKTSHTCHDVLSAVVIPQALTLDNQTHKGDKRLIKVVEIKTPKKTNFTMEPLFIYTVWPKMY